MKKLLARYLQSRGYFVLSPDETNKCFDLATKSNKIILKRNLDALFPYKAGKLDGMTLVLSNMKDGKFFTDAIEMFIEEENKNYNKSE